MSKSQHLRRATDLISAEDELNSHLIEADDSIGHPRVQEEMRQLRASVLHLTTQMGARIEALKADMAILAAPQKSNREAELVREVNRLRTVIQYMESRAK